MLDEFMKRLPTTATEERALVTAAFGITTTVREKTEAIRGNARLSEAGKIDDIRAMAKGAPLEHLRQIRRRVANMAADTQNLRLALMPKAPDRSDLWSELQRRELRDHLRTLPDPQRLRLAMEDPAITEAVLDANPILSGLSAEQLDLVRDGHIERHCAPQLRGIEQREEVIATLNAAVEIASLQFLKESGLDEKEIG
jgi:hypothetical protein